MRDSGRASSDALPSTLHSVCDRFEAAWKAGERPRMEDYLVATPGPQRGPLLRELLCLELYYRRRDGERPNPQEYLARFPDDRERIEAAFAVGRSEPDSPSTRPPEPDGEDSAPIAGDTRPASPRRRLPTNPARP
jgi:serine/threonine-protein kinase